MIEYRDCVDDFLVKFWPAFYPDTYVVSDLVANDADSLDVAVTPKLVYVFQAVAR